MLLLRYAGWANISDARQQHSISLVSSKFVPINKQTQFNASTITVQCLKLPLSRITFSVRETTVETGNVTNIRHIAPLDGR